MNRCASFEPVLIAAGVLNREGLPSVAHVYDGDELWAALSGP